MAHPLDGCIAKIDRAKEHRDCLHRYISDTLAIESNRARCGIKFEPDTGDYVLFVNYMPELGDFLLRCSLIFGDAVHNLLSTLDHLVYQLAILHTSNTVRYPSRIQFPICDTPSAWEEGKRRRLGEIAPNHVAIIERFQGYHRIDEQLLVGQYFHPLSMLRDLDSANKHRIPIRLLIPTTALTTGEGINSFPLMVLSSALSFTFDEVNFPAAELGAEVMRAKLPSGTIETPVDVACYVFPEIAIEGNWSVVRAFDKITALVIKIVREFEPFF